MEGGGQRDIVSEFQPPRVRRANRIASRLPGGLDSSTHSCWEQPRRFRSRPSPVSFSDGSSSSRRPGRRAGGQAARPPGPRCGQRSCIHQHGLCRPPARDLPSIALASGPPRPLPPLAERAWVRGRRRRRRRCAAPKSAGRRVVGKETVVPLRAMRAQGRVPSASTAPSPAPPALSSLPRGRASWAGDREAVAYAARSSE